MKGDFFSFGKVLPVRTGASFTKCWVISALLFASAGLLSAEQFGRFTYSVAQDDSITITAFSRDYIRDAYIPAEIDGRPVTTIGDFAFYYCDLTGVTIPEGVTSIGDSAFSICQNLTRVTIPGSVNSIGDSVFGNSRSLRSIDVEESNLEYASEGGVLFNVSKTRLILCPEAKYGDYAIPEDVTSIADSAFYRCGSLKSVAIPPSVISIGSRALSSCYNVTSIDVEEGNPSYASEGGVLFDIAETTLVSYPSGIAGGYAIPEGVTNINEYAFEGCNDLTWVTFPSGVTSIGNYAFTDCDLTHVTIPPSVISIGEFAFRGCTDLTGVTIPPGVTSIGKSAFWGCRRMTGVVTIPSGLTNINISTFTGCSGLTRVNILEGVTSIGGAAFASCSGLTHVDIPESVTSIGGGAFGGCSSLTGITIPEGVTSIEDRTFNGCSSLTGITIPPSVTSIGERAFIRCSAMTSVTIPPSVSSIGEAAFWGCSGLTGVVTIPEGVTSIGEYAFYECSDLTGVTIPTGVTSIEEFTFWGCSGMTSVTIPPSVSSIGRFAFTDCRALTSITIPPGVIGIHHSTFNGCRSLTGVTFPPSVTFIGLRAFSGCNLTSITIPDGVTYIGDEAFSSNPLTTALFLGDAPASFGAIVFRSAAPDFTIYYHGCNPGFASPTWKGYPAIMIDDQECPVAPWLVGRGLAYDTDLANDLNGDGVTLLMAYALDLDPNRNLSGSLPMPVFSDDNLGISFYGATEGINYTVEISRDLRIWTSEGVSITEPDPAGQRTASVDRASSGEFFARLIVTPEEE